jgi:hypothetical protein
LEIKILIDNEKKVLREEAGPILQFLPKSGGTETEEVESKQTMAFQVERFRGVLSET